MSDVTKVVFDKLVEYCKPIGQFEVSGNLDKDICEDICLLALVNNEDVFEVNKAFRNIIKAETGLTSYACITNDKKIYDETCAELGLTILEYEH